MTDVEIGAFLAAEGFVGAAAERAREVLEAAQLTRQGKLRLSNAKISRASALLRDRLVRVCQRPTCQVAKTTHERPSRCRVASAKSAAAPPTDAPVSLLDKPC
jgi:hypothetical protein